MGLMDKAKEAAQKAASSAQTAASQGQAKLSQYQQNQGGGGSADHAFTTLGRAFYAEQRQGGNTDAVVAALHAVDAALATPAVQPTAGPTTDGAPPVASSSPSAPPAAAPPAGNFTLDDL